MTEKLTIYIALFNEGTDTFRPTLAIDLGNGLYKLLPTENYDPEDEIWQFLPGSVVKAVLSKTQDSEDILLAIELIKAPDFVQETDEMLALHKRGHDALLQELFFGGGILEQIAAGLKNYDALFSPSPMILTKAIVKDILLRFLQGRPTAKGIVQWANIIEPRQDIDYLEHERPIISKTIRFLASPDLQGGLTTQKMKEIIAQLGE